MAIDKMVMAIVGRQEAVLVLEALIAAGYTATFSDSRSGMLRQAMETLFIGVESDKLDHVLSIVRDNCRSRIEAREAEAGTALPVSPRRTFAEVGSAVVLVWDIDRFETY
jgi:uncharacterized protein YaaQ